MKLTVETIATAALRVLDRVGLDALTMRLVAAELEVKAPALYWHLKNKQELLDAMAEVIYLESIDGLEAPRADTRWTDWLHGLAHRSRGAMLRHRDGARVYAGTNLTHPALYRTIELTLGTLVAAGFTAEQAARLSPTFLHYTVGFTIEEQARAGLDYGADNPYRDNVPAVTIDAERYPVTALALPHMFSSNPDISFDDGLNTILKGLEAQLPQQNR